MDTNGAAVAPQRPSGTLAWACASCGLQNTSQMKYCAMCAVAKPMDRRGVPQIFSRMVFHFNGIIPRSLPHPSHAVEWRMAERHGALCVATFEARVTHLIYRPGYERSDKVRAALDKHIPALPIQWMLDSLLQSRQMYADQFRLFYVPAEASALPQGIELPHHQHPFYVMNCEEYAVSPEQNATAGDGTAAKPKAATLREGPPKRTIAVPVVRRKPACGIPPTVATRSLFGGMQFAFSEQCTDAEKGACSARGGDGL